MKATVTQTREGTESAARLLNGLDLDILSATVKALRADPELGVGQFRATNRWITANHNRTSVVGFHVAKQEVAHRQPFDMDADEPPMLAGGDLAANPVEHLLHALASCVTTSMVAHAAVRGIPIRAVESEIEGDINLNGYLGLAPDVPRGYTDLRVRFKVDAEPRYHKQLKELAEFSPVFNTITDGARVSLQIEPK